MWSIFIDIQIYYEISNTWINSLEIDDKDSIRKYVINLKKNYT